MCIRDRRRVNLRVMNLAGQSARPGQLGVPNSHGPTPSLWDALCSVQMDGTIDAVISNGGGDPTVLPMTQPTGFFDIVDGATVEPIFFLW